MIYWQDGFKVVEHIFGNPVFTSCMDFGPYCKSEEGLMYYGSGIDLWRVYEC